MKSSKYLLVAALLAFPLATVTVPALAAGDAHDHGPASQAAMELNQGQKWGTDAALRRGMGAIHDIVMPALDKAHAGRMSPANYDDMSNRIMTQFTYVVENCKLPPAADAQLHILLGNVVQGLEAAQGKAVGQERESGLVQIAQALNDYGQFFDHPGWKSIDLAH